MPRVLILSLLCRYISSSNDRCSKLLCPPLPENVLCRLAWFVYKHVTKQAWFESFIMINIMLIGISTGLDLENRGRDAWVVNATELVAEVTQVVFTLECILKLVAEGPDPLRYFTDPDNGYFNTFDLMIVLASYIMPALGSDNAGAIGGLRMLRLVRLLTFVKNVPQLRVIIVGLVNGMKSVLYIVMLLFLVIYMFAILGSIIFGPNDPGHFGTVTISMMTLFQTSTLGSWTSIAYTSWFGCSNYLGGPYTSAPPFQEENDSVLHTPFGIFQGFACGDEGAQPMATGIFFACYILITSWVIMCLFIGVIGMGMFEAFMVMKDEERVITYSKAIAVNAELCPDDEATGEFKRSESIRTKMKKAEDGDGRKKWTLKERIDHVLEDETEEEVAERIAAANLRRSRLEKLFDRCLLIRNSSQFTSFITFTIVLVGLMTGVETDEGQACKRLEYRARGREEQFESELDACDPSTWVVSVTIGWFALLVFSFELAVKILAEGHRPIRFFTDRENWSWNWLDFFIVLVGWLEQTPAAFIFERFPVVLLRLVRLLRVFRLAKAFPQLRSIVEALISGFGAVGWIVVLMVVFNYIVACMCMLLFRDNDPFHYGSVGRAMFTVLRIETLDTWDQILYIAMFGCDKYPMGYPFSADNRGCVEHKAQGYGWLGAMILFFITIVGAYVLPTILIGIVSIKFDEASRFLERSLHSKREIKRVIDMSKEILPGYFTPQRLEDIRALFDLMDANITLELDLNQLLPFLHYVFDKFFRLSLTQEHCEAVFHLLDMNRGSSVGFDEFVMFIAVMKQIQFECGRDPAFAQKYFGTFDEKSSAKSWNDAMERVDAAAIEQAWDAVLTSINAEKGSGFDEKMRNLFSKFDSDGEAALDYTEIEAGMVMVGVRLTARQMGSFIQSIDVDGDGDLSVEEFYDRIKEVQAEKSARRLQRLKREALELMGPGEESIFPPTPKETQPEVISTAVEPADSAMQEKLDAMASELSSLRQQLAAVELEKAVMSEKVTSLELEVSTSRCVGTFDGVSAERVESAAPSSRASSRRPPPPGRGDRGLTPRRAERSTAPPSRTGSINKRSGSKGSSASSNDTPTGVEDV